MSSNNREERATLKLGSTLHLGSLRSPCPSTLQSLQTNIYPLLATMYSLLCPMAISYPSLSLELQDFKPYLSLRNGHRLPTKGISSTSQQRGSPTSVQVAFA